MSIWGRVVALFKRQAPGETRVYVSPRQAGVSVTQDTALTFGAVWACVSVISRTLAALPWRVFERSPDGRRPVEGTVSWLLNSQPNPEMTAFSFRETLLSHALLWGNAYAEIQRDDAQRPMALWPISPDRVSPERDEFGAVVYRVTDAAGVPVIIPARNMLHLHGMGFDGIVGYSPIQMAARSIGMGIAQDAFGAAFYGNGTVFGSVVELPATLNKQQIADSEAYHNERSGGPSNAFKVKVVPQGTKIHGISMPMTDAQFLESRKFSVNEIARWFGVPPHKIADLDRSTNNNIEHQGIEFVSDAIVPWAVRLEQECNVKLFGARAQGRVYTKLMVNALMRGDSKSRAEFYRTMTQIGAMSINEVRELEEWNSIGEAGDVHLVQLNQTTLERLVEEPPEAREPAADPPEDPQRMEDPMMDDDMPNNMIRSAGLAFIRRQA